jgi:hypothetical protein
MGRQPAASPELEKKLQLKTLMSGFNHAGKSKAKKFLGGGGCGHGKRLK